MFLICSYRCPDNCSYEKYEAHCSLLSIANSRFLVKVKFVCLSTEILLQQTFFRLTVLKIWYYIISSQAHCSKKFTPFPRIQVHTPYKGQGRRRRECGSVRPKGPKSFQKFRGPKCPGQKNHFLPHFICFGFYFLIIRYFLQYQFLSPRP